MAYHYRNLMAPFVVFGLAVLFVSPVNAQNLWDRIGNQVQDQLRQRVQRSLPEVTPPESSGQQPKMRSSSIPSEGGSQNISKPFDPSGFFQPQPSPPPRVINPSPTPQPYIPPQSYIPPQNSQRISPQDPTLYYSVPQAQQPLSTQPNQSQFRSSQDLYSPRTGTSTYRSPPTRSEARGFSGALIKVRCPKKNAQAVSYKLVLSGREYPYTMRPGESQSFAENQTWLIRFMNGSNEVTYELRGGNEYSFELDDSGRLQLYKDEPQRIQYAEPPTRTGG